MLDDVIFSRLGFEDIDDVLVIENQVYSHPWSRGNFLDSLYSGYLLTGLRDGSQQLVGYFLLMPVVDELHLLNLAVSAEHQGKGYARLMLDRMLAMSRERRVMTILLEVRVSNQRAIDVYRHVGFIEIGRRKGYYPADNGLREDAIVMQIVV